MTILTEADKVAKVKTGFRKAIQKNYGDLTTDDRFEVYPEKILTMKPETQKTVDNTGMDTYSVDQNANKTLPNTITTIRDYGFANDTSLNGLIITTSTVVTLGKQVFRNTKIESGEAFVYVPDNLLSAYQTDSTWTEYKNQLKAVSTLVTDTTQRNIIETVNEHMSVENFSKLTLDDLIK